MPGNIFISYRREDSDHFAGRLYDRLEENFGRERIFIDVDDIPLGADFVVYLSQQVAKCDCLIAIIGKAWADIRGEDGELRLHDPHDFVRIEIEAALSRNIDVIPIFIGNTPTPKSSQVPQSLHPLLRRHGQRISHESFASDCALLIRRLQRNEAERAARAAQEQARAAKEAEARAARESALARAQAEATAAREAESRERKRKAEAEKAAAAEAARREQQRRENSRKARILLAIGEATLRAAQARETERLKMQRAALANGQAPANAPKPTPPSRSGTGEPGGVRAEISPRNVSYYELLSRAVSRLPDSTRDTRIDVYLRAEELLRAQLESSGFSRGDSERALGEFGEAAVRLETEITEREIARTNAPVLPPPPRRRPEPPAPSVQSRPKTSERQPERMPLSDVPGKIKWIHVTDGYGYVTLDRGLGDAPFDSKTAWAFGVKRLKAGARVFVDVTHDGRSFKVATINRLAP